MPAAARIRPRAFDAAYGIVLLSCLAGIAGLASRSSWPQLLLLAGLTLASTLPWAVLRRQHSQESTPVTAAMSALLCLLGVALPALGLNFFGITITWFATLVLVLRHGARWAGLYILLAACLPGVLHSLAGRDPLQIILEALGTIVLPALAITSGWLVLSADRHRAHLEQLIAQRDEALSDVRRAHRELERAAAIEQQLALARERERAARDLHDGLGHRLTVSTMSLEFAGRTRSSDPDAAWREIERAGEQLRETSQWLRRWVRALQPIPGIEAVGPEAFEQIAGVFRGTGLDVQVRAEGEPGTLGQEGSLLACRILQEGLTNTLRAGTARSVSILAVSDARGLLLRLSDDGRAPGTGSAGSPPGDDDERLAPVSEGFGLRTLRARLQALGGTMRAGWGTEGFVLEARIPAAGARPEPAP